jgi:hypothetical protein
MKPTNKIGLNKELMTLSIYVAAYDSCKYQSLQDKRLITSEVNSR